jgi:hypothetical protein
MTNNIRPLIRNVMNGVVIREHITSIICREVREGRITEAKGREVWEECQRNPEFKEGIQRRGYIVPPKHLLG